MILGPKVGVLPSFVAKIVVQPAAIEVTAGVEYTCV